MAPSNKNISRHPDRSSDSSHSEAKQTSRITVNESAVKRLHRFRYLSYLAAVLALLGTVGGWYHYTTYISSDISPIMIPLMTGIIGSMVYGVVGYVAHKSKWAWAGGLGWYVINFLSAALTAQSGGLLIPLLGMYWGWRGRKAVAP